MALVAKCSEDFLEITTFFFLHTNSNSVGFLFWGGEGITYLIENG